MVKGKFLNLFLKFSYGGLISAAISFISTPITTALILPEDFGKASMFVLAFSFLLQLIVFGSDQSFVRFFYQDKYKNANGSLLINSIIFPFFLSFISILAILFYWRAISIGLIGVPDFKLASLLAILLFFGLVERFSTLLIRMSQKAVLFSNMKILQAIINTAVIVVYAKYVEASFFAIVYGSLVSYTVIGVLGVFIEKKQWFHSLKINRQNILEILKYGLPFVPTFVISWVFEGIDKMALRYYSNFNEIGIYAASAKIVAILTVLQMTFSNFWVPVSYEAYESDSVESRKLFESVYSGISALFFLTAIVIIAMKDFIILLFSGNYSDSVKVVPFLVFIPVMYTLSEITVGGINFKKKTYWHLIIAMVATFVNAIGVYFLVPHFGARGASISTGVAYIVFFYARTLISNYYFPLNFETHKTLISILVILIVAIVNTFYNDLTSCALINTGAFILVLFLYRIQLKGLYTNYLT